MADSLQWFYVDADGESKGPVTTEEIKQLPLDIYAWNGTTVTEWTQLKNIQLLSNNSTISNTAIDQEYDCQFMSDDANEPQSNINEPINQPINDTNGYNNHTNVIIPINNNNENKINDIEIKPSDNKPLNLRTLTALSQLTNDSDEEIIDEELSPEPIPIIPMDINELCIDISKTKDNNVPKQCITSPNMPLQNFENNSMNSLPKPFDSGSPTYIIHKIPKKLNTQIIAQPPSVNSFKNEKDKVQLQNEPIEKPKNIIECPLCTFHNNINAIQCDMCYTEFEQKQLNTNREMKLDLNTLPNELNKCNINNMITIALFIAKQINNKASNPFNTSKIEQLFIEEKLNGNVISKMDQKEFVNKAKMYDVPATKASKLLCNIRKYFKKEIIENNKSKSQNINVKVAVKHNDKRIINVKHMKEKQVQNKYVNDKNDVNKNKLQNVKKNNVKYNDKNIKNIKQKQVNNSNQIVNKNMKEINELDIKLEELMNDLEIPNTARIAVHKLPKDKKIQMINQYKQQKKETKNINKKQIEPKNKNINVKKDNKQTKIVSNNNENKLQNVKVSKPQQVEHKNNKSIDQNDNELNAKLEEMMNDLEIPNTARIAIHKLPKDKKIEMINRHKKYNKFTKQKEKKNSLFKKNKKRNSLKNNKLNSKPLTVNLDDTIDQRLKNNPSKKQTEESKKQIEKSNDVSEEKQKEILISVYDGYVNKYNKAPQNATQLMKFSKGKNEFKPLTFKQAKNMLNERENNKPEKKKKISKFWGKKKAKKVNENVEVFKPPAPIVNKPMEKKPVKKEPQTVKKIEQKQQVIKQPQTVQKIEPKPIKPISIWDINENEGDDPLGSTYRKKVIINNYNKSKIIEQTAESINKHAMGIVSPETIKMKSVFDESSSDESDADDNRLTVNLKNAKHNKVSAHVNVKM